MPCAATSRPAIGVSLLNAILQQHGVECDVAYLNLLFAELLGLDDYVRLIDRVPFRALAGEWVFAAVAWGTSSRRDSYLDNVLRRQHGVEKDDVDVVLRARDAAHGFIEESLRRIDWRRYGLVGFSSYTAQNLASLALADRVKAAHPKIKTVFGGANWRGAAGVSLHERLRFVDYAVSGEGDVSLPLLVRALEDESGQSLKQVPGLIYRENGVTTWNHESRPIEDLDRLPIPDFSDFYRWRQSLPNVLSTLPSVSVEGSRGCWWAKRGPCTFCGMAGPERHYRAKSSSRVLAEIRQLYRQWPASFVHMTDTVVSPSFLDEVLPSLANDPLPPRLFFEVRPNVTLDQLEVIGALRAEIQPGIESLNDHVLCLMHKGTRTLENIRLLKWCKQTGVTAVWNLLFGLPGEQQSDYDEMLELLPSIHFLSAPSTCQTVSVDRYSPYFDNPEVHGISGLTSLSPYRYLYPYSERVLRRIAYAFEYRCADDHSLPQVGSSIASEVAVWQREENQGDLTIVDETVGKMRLLDRRPIGVQSIVQLNGLESVLYASAENIAELSDLEMSASTAVGTVETTAIHETLADLVRRRLMVRVEDRYLSLALRMPSGLQAPH